MGLALEVGILADLNENDPEGAEEIRAEFQLLNRVLVRRSLPAHREPEEGPVWSASLHGYAGLHALRRVAAHLEVAGKLPAPGDDQASKDPVLARYFEAFEREESFGGVELGSVPGKRSFDHLIVHSDAEGYYLPQDFPDVIPVEHHEVSGWMVGSSPRLLEECRRLAGALQLPLDLDPESDEVWNAAERQGQGKRPWERYGIESSTCLRLYTATRHSIATGAAIVFC